MKNKNMEYGNNNITLYADCLISSLKMQIYKSNDVFWINKINNPRNMEMHLAIMVEPYLTRLLTGEKTIESRFSINMVAPYRKIKEGDMVILKKSGGSVVGIFEAGPINFFDFNNSIGLSAEQIKEKYNNRLLIEEDFWSKKTCSNYATLIYVRQLLSLSPIDISFKNRQSWVTLGNITQDYKQLCFNESE